jgi:hypothetical protein
MHDRICFHQICITSRAYVYSTSESRSVKWSDQFYVHVIAEGVEINQALPAAAGSATTWSSTWCSIRHRSSSLHHLQREQTGGNQNRSERGQTNHLPEQQHQGKESWQTVARCTFRSIRRTHRDVTELCVCWPATYWLWPRSSIEWINRCQIYRTHRGAAGLRRT